MPINQYNQVDYLINNFVRCISAFEEFCPFNKDQIECHLKVITLVRQTQSITQLLNNNDWYKALINVLQSWHMDDRGAELLSLSAIRESFLDLSPEIHGIENEILVNQDNYYSISVERKIWKILGSLKIGAQKTRLVVNSKALHHLLPDLIPPMDRKYTFEFFYLNPNAVQNRDEKTFATVWPQFIRIAKKIESSASPYLGKGMHTSIPKIIDNAIIGFQKLLDKGQL